MAATVGKKEPAQPHDRGTNALKKMKEKEGVAAWELTSGNHLGVRAGGVRGEEAPACPDLCCGGKRR